MNTQNHCLITGVNRGLGKYIALALLNEGWQVTGIGRKARNEINIPEEIHYIQSDLSVKQEIDNVKNKITHVPKLVIHSAVMYPRIKSDTRLLDEIERIYFANTFAPYKLTLDLFDMKDPSDFLNVIVINSESMYHADFDSGIYASSKASLRVLTTSLAEHFSGKNACISTLLLGPLADERKLCELQKIADKQGCSLDQITKVFIKKSNPDLVINQLIDYESCIKSVRYLNSLGSVANGMVCRLDGGSAGSLI